jgi:hypothetical protein
LTWEEKTAARAAPPSSFSRAARASLNSMWELCRQFFGSVPTVRSQGDSPFDLDVEMYFALRI